MMLYFKTKPTINGIIYKLDIDTDAKTFKRGCWCSLWVSRILISKKDRENLIEQMKDENYVEVDV